MSKAILVPIATGVEEIETMCLVDVLRRAGAKVTLASVETLQVTAAYGAILTADCLIAACQHQNYDLIVLPGGSTGAENLHDSQILQELLLAQKTAKRWYGAMCAAPALVLAAQHLIDDRCATAYPSFLNQLPIPDQQALPVVVDQNCVTSQGPGTALIFALKLVELLYDVNLAKQIAEELLVTY